jgi:hypothetical protein
MLGLNMRGIGYSNLLLIQTRPTLILHPHDLALFPGINIQNLPRDMPTPVLTREEQDTLCHRLGRNRNSQGRAGKISTNTPIDQKIKDRNRGREGERERERESE